MVRGKKGILKTIYGRLIMNFISFLDLVVVIGDG